MRCHRQDGRQDIIGSRGITGNGRQDILLDYECGGKNITNVKITALTQPEAALSFIINIFPPLFLVMAACQTDRTISMTTGISLFWGIPRQSKTIWEM